MVVGTVAAIAEDSEESTTIVTTSTTSTAAPVASLPCEPQMVVSNGVTYYLCSGQFYVQAYGDDGLVYVPVDAPR
jgi:hypothetical protein